MPSPKTLFTSLRFPKSQKVNNIKNCLLFKKIMLIVSLPPPKIFSVRKQASIVSNFPTSQFSHARLDTHVEKVILCNLFHYGSNEIISLRDVLAMSSVYFFLRVTIFLKDALTTVLIYFFLKVTSTKMSTNTNVTIVKKRKTGKNNLIVIVIVVVVVLLVLAATVSFLLWKRRGKG